MRLHLLIGCLLALLLVNPALGADVVKMGELPSISNAGLYLAMDKGYFQDKGITVDIERFASGGKMMAPLATGQIDVAIGAPSAGLFNAIASGQDFKIVADKGQIRPGHSFTPIIVRQDLIDSGKVKSLKDLKGMKIANGAKGIQLDFYLAKMLENVGLAYGDVEIVYMSYPDGVKALATRAIDAMIAPEPWGRRSEEQKVGTRMFLTEQAPSIATYQNAVIMFSGKFIKERPKVARAFIQAYVQGIKYYTPRGLKDTEVSTSIATHLKVPVETIRASIPFYIDPAGKVRVADLAAMQDWFHQMGWVKEKVPMDRVVDLSLLE